MKKGQKNIRSASSVAIDITYCIGNVFGGVSKKLCEHLFKFWQVDKEHKLGTD